LEQQSEAKGISPTFSKSKVKRIGLFQKFGKTKQSEVNLLKILQDRSKTNVFVTHCVKEEKRKKRSFVFLLKKAKKNEYNRSSTIEDLPLLRTGTVFSVAFLFACVEWLVCVRINSSDY
jgi:hypothetical protein